MKQHNKINENITLYVTEHGKLMLMTNTSVAQTNFSTTSFLTSHEVVSILDVMDQFLKHTNDPSEPLIDFLGHPLERS